MSFGSLAHAALLRANFKEGEEYLLTCWDAPYAGESGEHDSHGTIALWKGLLHASNDLFRSMTGAPAVCMHFELESFGER
jgi:hypothetical protein